MNDTKLFDAVDNNIIFNAASNGMVFTEEASGKIVEINAAWLRATGLTRAETIGRTAAELSIWPNRAERETCLAEIGQSGRVTEYRTDLVMKTETLPHLVSGEIVELAGGRYILWEFRDISTQLRMRQVLTENEEKIKALLDVSEQSRRTLLSILEDEKAAKQALKTRETQLREAQRIAHIGNWELKLPSGEIHCSDEIFHILEVDKRKVASSYDDFTACIHPEDRETVTRAFTLFLEQREPFSLTHRILLPDGRIKYVQEQGEASYDDQAGGRSSVGTMQDITELMLAEEELLRSIREKETLIRELYHRTKNTMQLIQAMISLQADEYSDNDNLQKVIHTTNERIQAISLVHQMLYQSHDLSKISIKEYVQELSALIVRSSGIPSAKVSLNVSVDEQSFLLDTAIPLGLILNELMTNSLKYAFPGDRNGVIGIGLRKEATEMTVLHYSDNGIGLPPGFDFRRQNTLGIKLIFGLGEQQMLGKMDFNGENGFNCVFEFNNSNKRARI